MLNGEVAEWTNAPVLKTGVHANGPRVRIPPSPPETRRKEYKTWRGGRVVEGDGLLNRYTDVRPYRGFESLSLRQKIIFK